MDEWYGGCNECFEEFGISSDDSEEFPMYCPFCGSEDVSFD